MVLVACEESQSVCKAFRDKGHEAYSCDILPCSGGHPEWHIRGDVVKLLNSVPDKYYDLIIAHLPCTKVAVSGNGTYGLGKQKHQERLDYISWAVHTWELIKQKSKKSALENPVSVLFQHVDYDEKYYIQPWQFGHGEQKKTGLATVGLPRLKPTNIVDGREQRIWKMPPSPDRTKLRSKTYQGIANAMADQWGGVI